ncbi:hypothetical protein FQN49_001994 [Arthroderma sp. PD_2]|nr:hypothetical protein FQN49_001994 [Arthroderma sp. PD_2]
MGNIWSQSAWVTSPPLTENNISDQSGKVFIITGANSGAGFQLAKILYGVNAHVYLACRSETRVNRAIRLLEAWFPDSKGILTWLPLDLANLDSIKPAAEHFLRMEKRLDVLWNNAGTLLPQISKSKQGYDLQMSTNTLGHYLLTRLLHPILKKTAESAPANSVRVCWASSIAADFSPEGGIDMDDLGVPIPSRNMWINYCISKAANNLLASEFGKQWGGDNILHIVCINSHVFVDTTLSGFWCINRPKAFNPGNLDTNLTRNVIPLYLQSIGLYLQAVALWPPRYGAYTELYAGLSPNLNIEQNSGAQIWPWGCVGYLRPDIEDSFRSEDEGGSGKAAKFWTWCAQETLSFS